MTSVSDERPERFLAAATNSDETRPATRASLVSPNRPAARAESSVALLRKVASVLLSSTVDIGSFIDIHPANPLYKSYTLSNTVSKY